MNWNDLKPGDSIISCERAAAFVIIAVWTDCYEDKWVRVLDLNRGETFHGRVHGEELEGFTLFKGIDT